VGDAAQLSESSMTDDPFKPRDATILRPRPGARRPDAPQAPAASPPPAPPPVSAAPAQAAPPSYSSAPRAPASAGNAQLQDFLAGGRNPLLAAAGPLLTLGSRLGSAVAQADINGLHNEAVRQVKLFEENAAAGGVAPEDVTVARYVLCTFVDSAVFRTPWGAQSDWAARSLLSLFHRESFGGEKFFQILDRVMQQPARYANLIELQYLCLALGFEGQYHSDPTRLRAAQDAALQALRTQRAAATTLSPHWQGVTDKRTRIWRLVPWWLVAIAGCVILVITWSLLRYQLGRNAAPLVRTLATQGVDLDYTPGPPVQAGLKAKLAAEEAAGKLQVEELGGRTLVTLRGAELFRSGSATLDPEYQSVIVAIARAAETVPGRLVVVGHTDDQPLRSLRFQDNFELSRERALAVATILRGALTDPGRVESAGVGDTQPRYTPPSQPDNRARNRRVEIVHEGRAATP
jgi:type VI secretion system protein ImpK